VRFIRRAQELGFKLSEVTELIQLRKNDPRRSAQVWALATAKLEDIEQKMQGLGAMREALLGLVEECACEGRAPACPIIEALNDPGELVVVAASRK